MTTSNSKLRAIVSIRNLVLGISTDWKELKTFGKEVDEQIHHASAIFIKNTSTMAQQQWNNEMRQVERNIHFLKDIMKQVVEKINQKDSENLAEIWNSHKKYSTDLLDRLQAMHELGKRDLPGRFHTEWANNWELIFNKFMTIQHLAEGSSLHLSMISEYAPDEVDELTDTILKNMPGTYTMEEALQYEKEYLEAYEQLKKEASRKKNLWDRFLDILAGGIQQSPAERVMMQRWINGEKENL